MPYDGPIDGASEEAIRSLRNGASTRLSVRKAFHAGAIVIEHSETCFRSVIVFRQAHEHDLLPAEDKLGGREVGTRIYVNASWLPPKQRHLTLLSFWLEVGAVSFEASLRREPGKTSEPIDACQIHEDIRLCYTLEIREASGQDPPRFESHQRVCHELPETAEVRHYFEKAIRGADGVKCIAPWSGASFVTVQMEKWQSASY